jgi:hypothetical protein
MSLSSKIGSLIRRCRRPASRGALPALLAALLLVGAARVHGEGPSAAANLVEPVVDAGQPAEYHIEVTNGRPDSAPPAPAVEGLSISYAGQSQSRQYSFDGSIHSSTTYTYVYSIETSRAGKFVIPSQDVRIGQQTFSVAPVTLNVMGGDNSGGGNGGGGGRGTPARQSYFAELVIPRKSAYIGESVPAQVRVYFGWDVQAKVDPSPILNGDGFSVLKFTPPQTSVAEIEGEQFRVATYKTALAGVKTGTISVGPAEVSPVVRVPRAQGRRRLGDPYDDPYFNDPLSGLRQGPAKQVDLHTEPVAIEIKPLPAGKPAEFSGAIGQFKLEAEVDPHKAATGDPVTVRLFLRGQGNFDRIEPPVLQDDTGLRTYPPTSKFKADDEVGLSGVKTFEQVLIADSARATLPGYRLSYFDPATGRYEVLETPPVAVAISGATIASPAPTLTTAALPSPTPRATPRAERRAPEDILYIRGDFGRERDALAFVPLYRRTGFWEVQGGAALFILVLAGVARARRRARDEAIRRAAELQRQRVSLNRTLREENTGRVAFYSAARRLAQLKAAAASSEPEADLTPEEICETKRLPPEVAGSVEEIFQRHDELAYSGRAKAQEPVPAEERRAVLATLETLGRN